MMRLRHHCRSVLAGKTQAALAGQTVAAHATVLQHTILVSRNTRVSLMKPRSFSFSVSSEGGEGTSKNNPVAAAGVGLFLLSGGMTVLAINERRHVKQEKWRHASEGVCQEVDANDAELPQCLKTGDVIHACGFLRADQAPTDPLLKFQPEGMLRLQREVAMYQTVEVEHKHQEKNKEGKVLREWFTYTYEERWSTSPQTICHSDAFTNPAFPDKLQAGTKQFEAKRLLLGAAGLTLGPKLFGSLTDYHPVVPSDGVGASGSTLGYWGSHPGLELQPSGELCTAGSNPSAPSIGDLRVTYKAISEGDFTVLGVHKNGMVRVYSCQLGHSLASEGEIIVPEAAERLARTTWNSVLLEHLGLAGENAEGLFMDKFIIPDWLIEGVEQLMLEISPIEVGLLKRGVLTKDEAFRQLAVAETSQTAMYRLAGSFAVFIGTKMILSPLSQLGLLSSAVSSGTSLFGTGGIAAQTMHAARAQLRQQDNAASAAEK